MSSSARMSLARYVAAAATVVLLVPLIAAEGQSAAIDVRITTAPSVVYTSTQEAYLDPSTTAPNAHTSSQNLTWMFHLVLESRDRRPLRLEMVDATFTRSGTQLWRQSVSRTYLEQMEWIRGPVPPDDGVLPGSCDVRRRGTDNAGPSARRRDFMGSSRVRSALVRTSGPRRFSADDDRSAGAHTSLRMWCRWSRGPRR